ncbi:KC11 [Enterospora canceri]|uniref:non-specific serine/threonine protein kinase n=1 Tax=Enterospora canceri TaxID=1081671 RepID=A0A1Y1S8V4_9MICR|nr:KC11 [Enterospora canceri]
MNSKTLDNLKLKTLISHGAFGEIYVAEDTNTGEEVAVKVEKKSITVSQIKHEFNIYRLIRGPATPRVFDIGRIEYKGDMVNCLSMELLGPSLEKIYNKLNREFSIKTLFLIGKTCLRQIEFLHHRHYVHRDIKPDNFVVSTSFGKLFLIDYGLAKEFRNPVTMVHRPYKDGKNLTGTARYASLNTHIGIEQSRRDDLESLGFMLIYFSKGRLPWQGLKGENKRVKYEKIKEVKRETTLKELCTGCPSELFLYMTHVRNLKYAEYPDYFYLNSLFMNGLKKRDLEDDDKFDWVDHKDFW